MRLHVHLIGSLGIALDSTHHTCIRNKLSSCVKRAGESVTMMWWGFPMLAEIQLTMEVLSQGNKFPYIHSLASSLVPMKIPHVNIEQSMALLLYTT